MATVIDKSAHNPKSPVSNTNRFFKRAYQACINCRRRKIKCMIECDKEGCPQSACVRCKRELRQCTFNADRRTQVTAESYAYGSQRTVPVVEGINLSLSDKQLQYVRVGIARQDLTLVFTHRSAHSNRQSSQGNATARIENKFPCHILSHKSPSSTRQ